MGLVGESEVDSREGIPAIKKVNLDLCISGLGALPELTCFFAIQWWKVLCFHRSEALVELYHSVYRTLLMSDLN